MPHLFLPQETTIEALAHSSLLSVCQPWSGPALVLPCVVPAWNIMLPYLEKDK